MTNTTTSTKTETTENGISKINVISGNNNKTVLVNSNNSNENSQTSDVV